MTPQPKGPLNVWVDRMGFASAPTLLSIFLKHGRFYLFFTAAGAQGFLLARLLRVVRILVGPPSHVEFTHHGVRLDDANSPRLRAQAEIPNSYTARIMSGEGALLTWLPYPDPRVQQRRVELNLHKEVATCTLRLMWLVELARYWHARRGDGPFRLAIVSTDAALAAYLSPLPDDPSVEFLCPCSRRQSLLLRAGRALLVCAIQMLRRRQPREASHSCAATEFLWGLDNTNRLNDLFWWQESKIPAERVVLFFDRADHLASREVVDQAQKLGIRCLALAPGFAGGMAHLRWRPAPGLPTSVRRLWREIRVSLWGFRQRRVGRWAACRLVDMLHHSAKVEDFLTEFNVGCLFHHQDIGADYLSLACDATGSARLGVHWSHPTWPEACIARVNQAYFVWGPHAWKVIEECGSCVDHVLMSGCFVNGAYPATPREGDGANHRALLASHGATRVLALFDTSYPGEGFYEFFLRKVLQDPRWGVLIKPKAAKLPWEQRHLPQLQALYREALSTGRVQLLDCQFSPAEAAAAADFAVGVDINSATVVAALAGHRAIHLDYLRLQESPLSQWANLYRAGPDRLVFDDPNKLWERLNRFFDEPGSDPHLGVADDELLRQIDPFRDGKAGERIGDYVRWYLEGLDGGLDRDLALEAADRRYADRWGAHTVVRGLPEKLYRERALAPKPGR